MPRSALTLDNCRVSNFHNSVDFRTQCLNKLCSCGKFVFEEDRLCALHLNPDGPKMTKEASSLDKRTQVSSTSLFYFYFQSLSQQLFSCLEICILEINTFDPCIEFR